MYHAVAVSCCGRILLCVPPPRRRNAEHEWDDASTRGHVRHRQNAREWKRGNGNSGSNALHSMRWNRLRMLSAVQSAHGDMASDEMQTRGWRVSQQTRVRAERRPVRPSGMRRAQI